MNLAQIEQLQNKIKRHLHLVSVHFSGWLSWSSSTHLYPMVKKFSYAQMIVNKTVLLHAIKLCFLNCSTHKRNWTALWKRKKSTQFNLPNMQSAQAAEQRLGSSGEKRASGEPGAWLCQKGCSLGGIVPSDSRLNKGHSLLPRETLKT